MESLSPKIYHLKQSINFFLFLKILTNDIFHSKLNSICDTKRNNMLSKKLNDVKNDVISSLPYIGTGLAATLPINVPYWGLLSGVVCLGFLTSYTRNHFKNRYKRRMQFFHLFDEKIKLEEETFLISPDLVQILGLNSSTIPCTLSDKEYNSLQETVFVAYLCFMAKNNLEQNMLPSQSAYKALSDVITALSPTKTLTEAFQQQDQTAMLIYYHLSNLFQDMDTMKQEAEFMKLNSQLYHFVTNNLDEYRYNRLFIHPRDVNFIVNQEARQNTKKTKLRGMFLGSTALILSAGGLLIFGDNINESTLNKIKYLSLTSIGTLGLWHYTRKKHVQQELFRFDNDSFLPEIIQFQKQEQIDDSVCFVENVTRLTPATKLRYYIQCFESQLDFIRQTDSKSMGELYGKIIWENLKKTPENSYKNTVLFHLKQGATIEDIINLYGIEKTTETLSRICSDKSVPHNKFASISTYYNELKQRHAFLSNRYELLKEQEENIGISTSDRSFADHSPTTFTLSRDIVVPSDIKIHPAVKRALIHGREQYV